MGFSRQEYWSGLPFPSPGDLPHPGIEPGSPSLWADALTSEPPGKPQLVATLNYSVFQTENHPIILAVSEVGIHFACKKITENLVDYYVNLLRLTCLFPAILQCKLTLKNILSYVLTTKFLHLIKACGKCLCGLKLQKQK